MGLIGSNRFLLLPSISKISKPFDTFIELLTVFILYVNMKDEILDKFMWFHEVILLGMRYMVDSMA